MFAYTNNNCINYTDTKGHYPVLSVLQDETTDTTPSRSSENLRVAVIYDANKHYNYWPNTAWLAGPAKGGIWERAGADVDLYPHYETQGLIDSWNALDGKNYDFIYIYVHGNVNLLGYTNAIGGQVHSFDELHNISVNGSIELYSCYGGKSINGNSVAQTLANKANCAVTACSGKTYNSILNGISYRANPWSSAWITCYPQT